ncbi:MAG TPA: cupin domain-containing protein, partial [Armatimonadota bacterium]|nr:cupin domain-containing protein [Armatimonadota bacterium]
MITRRELIQGVPAATALGALLPAAAEAVEDAGARSMPRELLRQALPDVAGKEVSVVTVTYPPGASSRPHRHPGSVIGYVLEGELVMQMKGEPAVTYRAGDVFYEKPGQVHAVSRNAS